MEVGAGGCGPTPIWPEVGDDQPADRWGPLISGSGWGEGGTGAAGCGAGQARLLGARGVARPLLGRVACGREGAGRRVREREGVGPRRGKAGPGGKEEKKPFSFCKKICFSILS